MTPITLFACDSQPIVLEGLQRVLEPVSDLALVGMGTSVPDSLEQIRSTAPRVVLIGQQGGLKTLFRLLADVKAAAPTCCPVLWVAELAEVDCFRALQVGARGILKKTLPIAALLECVRATAGGQIWIEPMAESSAVLSSRKASPRLTPRERDIVRCLCQGMRNKEIAQALAITPGTVKVHLMHIFEKTGAKDRFELAAQARGLPGLEFSRPDPALPSDPAGATE